MREICVVAYPYAVQQGTILVPDDVIETREYIIEHFDEIKFGHPDLDYCDCDFEDFEM